MDDDSRRIILARRARFLAAALAGVGLTSEACGGKSVTDPNDVEGAAGSATSQPRGVAAQGGEPVPCLQPVAGTYAIAGGGTGGIPEPCLTSGAPPGWAGTGGVPRGGTSGLGGTPGVGGTGEGGTGGQPEPCLSGTGPGPNGGAAGAFGETSGGTGQSGAGGAAGANEGGANEGGANEGGANEGGANEGGADEGGAAGTSDAGTGGTVDEGEP